MKQVRSSMFETNSSATHSLILTTENMFDRLGEDCLIIGDEIVEISEETRQKIRDCHYLKFLNDNDYLNEEGVEFWEKQTEALETFFGCDESEIYSSLEDWSGNQELDTGSYTTPGGEVIKWAASYGSDY